MLSDQSDPMNCLNISFTRIDPRGPFDCWNSTQPVFDPTSQSIGTDAVAIVQRRQRAGVEEGIGKPGQLEARRLHSVAE
jgi:hypothetical protein